MRRYARTAFHGKPHGPPENVSLLVESFYYLLDIFYYLLDLLISVKTKMKKYR